MVDLCSRDDTLLGVKDHPCYITLSLYQVIRESKSIEGFSIFYFEDFLNSIYMRRNGLQLMKSYYLSRICYGSINIFILKWFLGVSSSLICTTNSKVKRIYNKIKRKSLYERK